MMKIILGDWLTNAGIIGYLRICELAGKMMPDLSKGSIEINPSDLEHFTESYFTTILMLQAEGIFSIRFRSKIITEIEKKIDEEFYEFRKKFGNLGDSSFRKIAYDRLNNTVNSQKNSYGFLCRFCKQNRVMPKEFDDVDSIFAYCHNHIL